MLHVQAMAAKMKWQGAFAGVAEGSLGTLWVVQRFLMLADKAEVSNQQPMDHTVYWDGVCKCVACKPLWKHWKT